LTIIELARFDTQLKLDPEISGKGYQQGTLHGYETREYLLAKWGRKCAYCGAEGLPLQIDRVKPKSGGGSDRVSNLTLACQSCNQKKGSLEIREFLAGRPELASRILAKAKAPLLGAAP
jgi:5-methylcytosine-specific restriction endonuclease McrA